MSEARARRRLKMLAYSSDIARTRPRRRLAPRGMHGCNSWDERGDDWCVTMVHALRAPAHRTNAIPVVALVREDPYNSGRGGDLRTASHTHGHGPYCDEQGGGLRTAPRNRGVGTSRTDGHGPCDGGGLRVDAATAMVITAGGFAHQHTGGHNPCDVRPVRPWGIQHQHDPCVGSEATMREDIHMLCSGNAVHPVEYTIHLRPAELDQAHSMRGLTTDLRQGFERGKMQQEQRQKSEDRVGKVMNQFMWQAVLYNGLNSEFGRR
ncbi:hypothetical protein B0H14DRAFT_3134228 [Mycena olivaceomarginata]|nr:hypothetical protein B0H14DRAFT_3134228 [Mycena olivaceomarginata]